MAPHVDILDEPEPLKGPLAGSIILHVSIAAALVAVSAVSGRQLNWGDSTSGGGNPMLVGVVNQVPLPSHSGTVNPVANNTTSEVPEPKPDKVQRAKVLEPEPDAIPLQSRKQPKASPKQSSVNSYRAKQIDRPNQLYNAEGQALVSPMIGMSGSGGVGFGRGSPFGDRFGYYADLLRQKVAEKWRVGDVDPRVRTLPPAVVTFTIRRDGSVYSTRVEQTSGNFALDLSAQRAIADAAPFPPLPAQYDRNEVQIELSFNLQR
jgi:protein TonB